MSHGLTKQDTMFSVGSTPWHRLGAVIDAPPTIAEALALAGLDWKVETRKNYTATRDGQMVETPSQSVWRTNTDGTEELLGSVGPVYHPLQNAEAFAWFQPWLDTGRVTLETAGTLFGGRRVWVLAKIAGDPIVVKGDDVVERYVLLAHAHDGTLAIRAGLTPIRVVCNNTLSAAIGIDARTGRQESTPADIFKVLHRSNATERLSNVAEQLDAIDHRLALAADAWRFLASVPVKASDTRAAVETMVAAAWGQSIEQAGKGRRVDTIADLFETGAGADLEAAKGTHWGLWQALTEYTTHHAGRSDENRADASVFGAASVAVKRGLDACLVMARKTYSVADVFGEFSAVNTLAIAEHPDAILRVAS